MFSLILWWQVYKIVWFVWVCYLGMGELGVCREHVKIPQARCSKLGRTWCDQPKWEAGDLASRNWDNWPTIDVVWSTFQDEFTSRGVYTRLYKWNGQIHGDITILFIESIHLLGSHKKLDFSKCIELLYQLIDNPCPVKRCKKGVKSHVFWSHFFVDDGPKWPPGK